jgi:hypothetical protein
MTISAAILPRARKMDKAQHGEPRGYDASTQHDPGEHMPSKGAYR